MLASGLLVLARWARDGGWWARVGEWWARDGGGGLVMAVVGLCWWVVGSSPEARRL